MTGATRKQKEKKVFSLKCIQKSNVIKKIIWVLVFGFMYLVLVDAMAYTQSPIIRNGPIRLGVEFWGKFKK